jgi:hypothetical protein
MRRKRARCRTWWSQGDSLSGATNSSLAPFLFSPQTNPVHPSQTARIIRITHIDAQPAKLVFHLQDFKLASAFLPKFGDQRFRVPTEPPQYVEQGRWFKDDRECLRFVCFVPSDSAPSLLSSSAEGEPMGNLSVVVQQLKKERTRLADELHRVTAALTAFGKAYISGSNPKAVANTTRTISVAGRKRIAEAQRARWAKQKQAQKPKRTMSAAGRKRIAEAQRLRWAKLKAPQQKKAA